MFCLTVCYKEAPAIPESWHGVCDIRCWVSTQIQDTATANGSVIENDGVDAHADYLFNFAVGQLRDVSVAEDLVQDVLLAALKARGTFRGQSSVRTWLVAILRHKICDHQRRSFRERLYRRERKPLAELSDEWEKAAVLWLIEATAESQSPVRQLELSELREALTLAIGKLPPRLAQVFQLYEIEEKPNREVCKEMNISETNLWVMLHRARARLKIELANW